MDPSSRDMTAALDATADDNPTSFPRGLFREISPPRARAHLRPLPGMT